MNLMPIARVARTAALAVGAAAVVFVAGMLPWWVIRLIEPRPNRVFFAAAEWLLEMRDLTPELALGLVWVNGALLVSEGAAAYLVAFFLAAGRWRAGWLWGVAIGVVSIGVALSEPIFQAVTPTVPGRVLYSTEHPPVVVFLRNLMAGSHLVGMVFLPQVGGVVGALAGGRRRREISCWGRGFRRSLKPRPQQEGSPPGPAPGRSRPRWD